MHEGQNDPESSHASTEFLEGSSGKYLMLHVDRTASVTSALPYSAKVHTENMHMNTCGSISGKLYI